MDSYLRKPLEKLFQAPSHISVLRVLHLLREGISGREIARRAQINDRNCRLILNRLEVIGVVSYQGSGKVRLYQLNRNHFFVKHFLTPLFKEEPKYFDEVKEQIKKSLKDVCVWMGIFGSVSKGHDLAESDLDILILVNNEEQKSSSVEVLDRVEVKVLRKYGVALSYFVMTVDEWYRNNHSFHDTKLDILAKHITLIGDDSIL